MKDERTPGKVQQNEYDIMNVGGVMTAIYTDTNTMMDQDDEVA